MEAGDDGGPAFIILDDVKLPKRARLVELVGSELRDVALKLALISLAGKADALDVPRCVEVRIVDPPTLARAAFDVLPEPGHREEPLRDGALHLVEVERPLKYKDAHDDHGVCRPVHPQPGRIHG